MKLLIIGLGATSAVVAIGVATPAIIKSKANNGSSSGPTTPEGKKLKFKSDLLAWQFGLENYKANDAKSKIDKLWVIQNKDKLFEENNYLNFSDDIVSLEVTNNGTSLSIKINDVQGYINGFLPESTWTFNEWAKFPLETDKAISTYGIDDKSVMDALVQYLYQKHVSATQGVVPVNYISKGKVQGLSLEWSIDLNNSIDALNVYNRNFLSKAFFGKTWDQLVNIDSDLLDTKRVNIKLVVEKKQDAYQIMPAQIDLVLLSRTREIVLPQADRAKNAYPLAFKINLDKPIGSIIDLKSSGIEKLPVVFDKKFAAAEFGINEAESLDKIARQLATPEWIWNNRAKLFKEYSYFTDQKFIETITFGIDDKTKSINLIINWVGKTEKTNITITVSDDGQLRAIGLDKVRKWNSDYRRSIKSGRLHLRDFKATTPIDILEDQNEAMQMNIPLATSGTIVNSEPEDDRYYVQLHNNNNNKEWYDNVWDNVFRAWFQWGSFKLWKETQRAVGILPNVDAISNIKLKFRMEKHEQTFSDGRGYRILIFPREVVIEYKKSSGIEERVYTYSPKLQEELKTYRDYIVLR